MVLSVQPLEDEQRLSRALVMLAADGEEVALPPGPYWEVAEINGAVHALRVESLSRVVKNCEQPVLIPEGIRGFVVELAAAADDVYVIG